MYSSTQFDKGRTAPWATRLAVVKEVASTGISGMLLVYFLLSVLWLSSPRGVRSCGGRHGLGSSRGPAWAVRLQLSVFKVLCRIMGMKLSTRCTDGRSILHTPEHTGHIRARINEENFSNGMDSKIDFFLFFDLKFYMIGPKMNYQQGICKLGRGK